MIVVKVPHLYKRNIRNDYKSHIKDVARGAYQIRITNNYYLVCKKIKYEGGWYHATVMTAPIGEGQDLVDQLNKDATRFHIPLTFAWEQ